MPLVPAPRPSITGEERDLTSSKYRVGSAELVSAATRRARSASTTGKLAARQREGRVAKLVVGRFIRMSLKKTMSHSECYDAVANLSNVGREQCMRVGWERQSTDWRFSRRQSGDWRSRAKSRFSSRH